MTIRLLIPSSEFCTLNRFEHEDLGLKKISRDLVVIINWVKPAIPQRVRHPTRSHGKAAYVNVLCIYYWFN